MKEKESKTDSSYGEYFMNRTSSDIAEEWSEQRDEWIYLSPKNETKENK